MKNFLIGVVFFFNFSSFLFPAFFEDAYYQDHVDYFFRYFSESLKKKGRVKSLKKFIKWRIKRLEAMKNSPLGYTSLKEDIYTEQEPEIVVSYKDWLQLKIDQAFQKKGDEEGRDYGTLRRRIHEYKQERFGSELYKYESEEELTFHCKVRDKLKELSSHCNTM